MCCFCSFILNIAPILVGVVAIIVALCDSHKSGKAAQKQIDEIKDLCQLQMKSNRDAIELEIARLEVEIAKTDSEIAAIEEMLAHQSQRSVITLHENPDVLRTKKSALEKYKSVCKNNIEKLTKSL